MLIRAFFRPLLALLLLGSCRGTEPSAFRFTRFAMDTVVDYTIVADSEAEAQAAVAEAHAEIERVSRLLWQEDPGSPVHAFNQAGGRVTLEPEVYAFLERCVAYSRVSDGAFDVTIGPVLDLYGFDAEDPRVPTDGALAERLRAVGFDHLRFAAPGTVDKPARTKVAVGGVAKGYAVDRAVDVLRRHGIRDALVNAGGDLYALGSNHGRPWVVGIRHPDDPAAIIDTLFVADRAVATSGDYQRFVEVDGVRYHHLLDPATGRPARGVRSATVLAATAEEADALATAAFVLGMPDGLGLLDRMPDADGLLVDSVGTVHRGLGFSTR